MLRKFAGLGLILAFVLLPALREYRFNTRVRNLEKYLTTTREALIQLMEAQGSTNAKWIGHPMIFDQKKVATGLERALHFADDIEIGCRGDGVIVWKPVPFDSNAPQISIWQEAEK